VKTQKRKELGEYVVSDPEICGGELAFKGTRILVKDVLYFVARGLDWDSITNEYHGLINREAIAEAVALARTSLVENVRPKRSSQRANKQRRGA
jgi:uncharacterized protein (DUF433 family)